MRQAVTGWLVLAGCLVILGVGTIVGAKTTRGAPLTEKTIREWRQYATEVEEGTRTPSPMTFRTLTEAAIAQHQYADSAERLLLIIGGGMALLGGCLAADLLRYRTRHLSPPPGTPAPGQPA